MYLKTTWRDALARGMARTSRRVRRGASAGRARRAPYGTADTVQSKFGRRCKCEYGRVHGVIWQRYWGAFPWPSLTRRWASMIRGTGPRTRARLPGTLCVDLTGIIVPEGLRREDTIQRTLGSWREPTTQIAVCMRDLSVDKRTQAGRGSSHRVGATSGLIGPGTGVVSGFRPKVK